MFPDNARSPLSREFSPASCRMEPSRRRPLATTPFLAVGDSFWEGDAAPNNVRISPGYFRRKHELAADQSRPGRDAVSSTPSPARLNFQDQIAPPAEAWRSAYRDRRQVQNQRDLSGGPRTTAALPVTSTQPDIATALNALSNVESRRRIVQCGTRRLVDAGDIVGHGIAGATLKCRRHRPDRRHHQRSGRLYGRLAENFRPIRPAMRCRFSSGVRIRKRRAVYRRPS